MENEGKYIYCIINGIENRRFGPIGINNREVKLVPYKDISAVVSPTPVIKFDRLDKKELTRHVAIHQQVNEEIMKDYDVVPMTFGIIAPSSEEASRILEKAYLQFKTALKKVIGKAEFVVQVWWDPKRLLEEIAKTSPKIQKLREDISSKGKILGIPIKLGLGKLIQKEAELRRKSFINDIYIFLRGIAHDSTFNRLLDEKMIANLSFLIEKAKESELDAKMQELGNKYGQSLRFKYIGPMPPYSFSNINLSLGNFEIIDEARKLLGLDEEATFDEIQKAYHTLAHQYHPDKHQQDKGEVQEKGQEQMKKIVQAYNILGSYCRSCYKLAGGKVEGQRYSFKKGDVENSLIIK